jgi:hypothetical protein
MGWSPSQQGYPTWVSGNGIHRVTVTGPDSFGRYIRRYNKIGSFGLIFWNKYPDQQFYKIVSGGYSMPEATSENPEPIGFWTFGASGDPTSKNHYDKVFDYAYAQLHPQEPPPPPPPEVAPSRGQRESTDVPIPLIASALIGITTIIYWLK